MNNNIKYKSNQQLHSLGISTLIFAILVILWGAFVRISKSGAGCKDQWPLCNGSIIPLGGDYHTYVEFAHRTTSGLYLIVIFIFARMIFKAFPKKHLTRKFAAFSILFSIIEAAVGAVLVLLRLVENNQSIARAIVASIHLVNTLFLLASILFTILAIKLDSNYIINLNRKNKAHKLIKKKLFFSFIFFVAASCLGVVVALAGTLFPTDSLREGMQLDFQKNSHIFLKIRVLHPVFAVITAIIISSTTRYIVRNLKQFKVKATQKTLYKLFNYINIAISAQVLLGFSTMFLLAPIWMQIAHLLTADILWLLLASLAFYVFVEKDLNN